jgi:hypothetical protein
MEANVELLEATSRERGHHERDKDKIKVFVNDHPVVLIGKKQTGLDIKSAAVSQGVPIGPDFVLSVERGHGHTEIIGDTERIVVKEDDHFLAIPNDDNS